jgi:hypothetical protein
MRPETDLRVSLYEIQDHVKRWRTNQSVVTAKSVFLNIRKAIPVCLWLAVLGAK